jgi:ADP-dependent NAD(P)H-hydrate dehydratase / NAD(P)H-hydrate epimerase
MKILTAEQIREWDRYTIRHEPVASLDLMERAVGKCVEWLQEKNLLDLPVAIICGKGNNGGDGLAIARMLAQQNIGLLNIYILETGSAGSEDFQTNLERLHYPIRFIQSEKNFPSFRNNEIIIDALFGSGLNRPLDGVAAKLADHINHAENLVISIDLPSGLPADGPATTTAVIKADHILSFQAPRFSFLLSANAPFVGKVHILDIGLHPKYYESVQTNFELIDDDLIREIYKPRNRFAHKGNFGHALIIAGSYGKMGAAALATKACLRAGAGLTTVHIPRAGYAILQSAAPEAMVSSDPNSYTLTKIEEDLSKFDCIGIGPGLGTATETKEFLKQFIFEFQKPLVLDADALNILATEPMWLSKIPANSILTPHPKEFSRLFGETTDDLQRMEIAQQKAKQLNVVIVLKGHHTLIATPGGKAYFNNTGNAGMAKGGSGDVLTGMLTALVCQYKDTVEAAILGVYLHGLAGDIAAKKYSEEAMIANDVVGSLGEAFMEIHP